MPTNLDEFNTSQDALTIFFNEQSEQNMIESWMSSIFEEGQYIYFEKGQFSGNGYELFQYLNQQIREGEALLPSGERLIFCYYLPLEELTEEWVDMYFEKVREIKKYIQADSLFNQHYMLCFNYRVNTLNENDFDRIVKLLIRLGTEEQFISQQIYLMRIAGFEEYTNQEHALVQLLHLMSRRDYHKAIPAKYGIAVRMIDYLDYYEDRARNCQEMIEKLDSWNTGASDPELKALVSMIKIGMQPAIVKLREAGRSFRRKSQLYPVSINDFEGNLFTGYRSRINANHPKLQKRRAEYTERKRQELLEGVEVQEVRKKIAEEYHYPDFEELQKQLENGGFRKSIMEGCSEANTEPEVSALAEDICKKYELLAGDMTKNIEALRKKKQIDKKRYQKELAMAGRYTSLKDCFEKINNDIKPGPIRGKFSDNVNCLTLISGKCLDEWQTRQYEVSGVGVAYRYPSIKPCEIVELVEYDIVNLDGVKAKEELKLLF